jgi:hypothetical protein
MNESDASSNWSDGFNMEGDHDFLNLRKIICNLKPFVVICMMEV